MVDPEPLIHQSSIYKQNSDETNIIEQMDSNNMEQGKIGEDSECPPETKWEVKCRCCGLHYVTVENSNFTFCNWWQCLPVMPIFVGLLIVSMHLHYFFLIFPNCSTKTLKITSAVLVCFFGFLFFISYYCTAFTDPGFLPFNWVLTKKTSYTWEEQLSGLAFTKNQQDYAKSHRPPKASFSSFSGRFVLRADHICGWVSNWIGQRNHKFFFLMNFYGSIFAIILLILQCFIKSFSGWQLILNIVVCGFQFLFGFFMLGMFTSSFIDLLHSRTQISSYKNEEAPDEPCLQAIQHVFGYGFIPCWFCPVPPFPNGLDQIYAEHDPIPVSENNENNPN